MKTIINIFPVLFLVSFMQLKAQSDSIPSSNAKEFYISFEGFNPLNIGLRYKKQIGTKTYFKVGLVALSAQVRESKSNSPASFPLRSTDYSGGLEIGFERRKAINKKLSFYHGPAIRAIYSTTIRTDLNPAIPQPQQKTTMNTITGAIPYSLGLLFQVYNNFHAAVEINPSIYGSYSTSSQMNSNSSFSAGIGFNNQYALFSLVYRF